MDYKQYNTEQAKSTLKFKMQINHTGIARAVTGNELVRELWGDEAAENKTYNSRYHRSLRSMIEDINAEGGVICSDSTHGYWWAADLKDGMPAAEANERRAKTQLDNARALMKNITTLYGGQMDLFNGR